MTKFIFTVTSAVATMLGQVYNEKLATVTESKVEKIAPVAAAHCPAKTTIHVIVPNKKQLPS